MALSLIVIFLLRKDCTAKVITVVCFGLATGMIWYQLYDAYQLGGIRELDGQTLSVSMTADDYSYTTDYGVAVDGSLEVGGRNCRVRIYINEQTQILPGDTISGSFQFRYTSAGGLREPTYHRGEGIFLIAYPRDDEIIIQPGEKDQFRYFPTLIRQKVLQSIADVFPKDTMAFAKALLLGDTSDLSYQTDADLKISGIRHVVAVSGLHVSILFSLVYLITGRRRFSTLFIGVPVLCFFAAIAGFTPSIMRACLMHFLMILSMTLRREYDPPTALAFAVFIMLGINPLTVTSAGFQLSVGSVAGIILFSGRIHGWLLSKGRLGDGKGKTLKAKVIRYIATSVSVTLSAMIMTTPLTALYFGTVSLIGIVTNLLCLWVISFVFYGIAASCVLSLLHITLGKIVAWLLSWVIRGILAIAGLLADFPLAAVYTVSGYITAWLVFCYLLLGVFVLCRGKRTKVLVYCIAFSLWVALLVSWAEPTLEDYRVTVLDVGQGQCVLLQSEGKTYMVDCGGDDDESTADTAAAYLLSQGIMQLDGVILSHYDRDHVGGVEYLLTRIPTDTLILPVGEDPDNYSQRLTANHAPIYAVQDMEIKWGDASITIFAAESTHSSNESSLCVLFHTKKCDILITGDRSAAGEILLTVKNPLPKLDALIVGHHGAANSTSNRLLDITKPDTAVISVSKNNSYGQPDISVLDRLTAHGCRIRRTDLEGTIILRG